jgi:hypothetical protein
MNDHQKLKNVDVIQQKLGCIGQFNRKLFAVLHLSALLLFLSSIAFKKFVIGKINVIYQKRVV